MKIAYKAAWSWPKHIERWVREQTEGYTLNMPCGKSRAGDVRADMDPQFKPDVVCDMFHPPFKDQSFDTVICDPPFAIYCRQKWALRIADLARKKVVLACPPVRICFGKPWEKEWWVLESPGVQFLRMFQVFRFKNDRLPTSTISVIEKKRSTQ